MLNPDAVIVDWRAAWRDDGIDSALKVKPASRGVRLDVWVDGVSVQLENDETFVLPSATVNLNVVMGSDAPFPQMRG